MKVDQVWRTTSFRLSLVFGVLFALSTAALLASVDLQTGAYLDRRVNGIIEREAAVLLRAPPDRLPREIEVALAVNGGVNVFAIFSADQRPLAGDLHRWPAGLRVGAGAIEAPPVYGFPAYARLKAFALADGDILVVGRDVALSRELRAIVGSALVWSGAAIVIIGSALGLALSVHPMKRLRLMQEIAGSISAGDFTRRMPVSRRRDELDMVAASVNVMMGEIERLMREVKSATDSVAHDLRTPLAHVRARLHRLQGEATPDPLKLQRLTLELDEVLDRFRALMRLSELESPARRSGFSSVDLNTMVRRAVELYAPVAEEQGSVITLDVAAQATTFGDERLLFEALTNLIDNALKFAGPGSKVRAATVRTREGAPSLIVEDDGPGVTEAEREAVLSRFYRGSAATRAPGSGLGLSLVAAIVRLHGFELQLQPSQPGLRAIIRCARGAA